EGKANPRRGAEADPVRGRTRVGASRSVLVCFRPFGLFSLFSNFRHNWWREQFLACGAPDLASHGEKIDLHALAARRTSHRMHGGDSQRATAAKLLNNRCQSKPSRCGE